MAPYNEVKPFSISVPEDQLDELRTKLRLTRLPDELDLPAGKEWDWGIPLAVLKPAVDYWRTQYDWRAVEGRINRTLPQFTTYVESAKHGEQEVSKIIEELVNPKDPKHPSFHVVAPSLPGFVFSQRADTPGMNNVGSAYVFDQLMAKLGYKHYVAQGGDWGSLVVRALAVYHQDTCLATHSNVNFLHYPTPLKNPIMTLKTTLALAGLPGGYPKDEIDGIANVKELQATGLAYQQIQGTVPQTLAVALTDSPVGLLAWIGEKLFAWYWITGPAGGLRYYKENSITGPPKDPELGAELGRLRTSWSPTPFGFSWFPKEIVALPVEWAGLRQKLVYSKKHNKGGHFAAWEVPELLANDIQNFVSIVLENEPRLLK